MIGKRLLSPSVISDEIYDMLHSVEEEADYESFLSAIPSDCLRFFEENGIDLAEEYASLGIREIFSVVFSIFRQVFVENIPLLSLGILLCVLFKLVSSLFPQKSRMLEVLGYLSVISSGIFSFSVVEALLVTLTELAEQTSAFLTAALPVLCASQALGGGEMGAAVLSGTLPVILTVLSTAVSVLFYPLCWFCYAASLCGFFREHLSFRPFLSSVKRICKRGVEIFAGLSVGVFCVERAVATSSDTMVRNGIRFALAEMIPLAGGTITKGIESVFACGKSLTGRIGVLCVFVIGALYAVPCITGVLFVFLYSVLASLGEFFDLPVLIDFFSDLRDTFAMMTTYSVGSLIVLSTALLILTGGG